MALQRMNFEVSVPILIEKVQPEGEQAYYRSRPVFIDGFECTDSREDRAMRFLRERLRTAFTEHAASLRHDTIAQWSYHPELKHRRLDLNLTLRKHTLRMQLFVVMFKALDRTLVTCPQIVEVCFEVFQGESVQQRAEEVYTEHFRYLEKKGVDFSGYQFSEIVYAHLDTIDLRVTAEQKVPAEDEDRPFAFLGAQQELSGAQELERTGRCLNRLYPNDLLRAMAREDEVRQISEWFQKRRRKDENEVPPPLVIVGPNQVGKTALVHEWIYRASELEEKRRPAVWLLSPQRLISGMSYLGQWEERVISILEEAIREKLVLYFDDLIGLFHAGKSRDSNLTVGQVLKLHMEEGKLRVVAEATPAGWRKLREVDRAFADLFTVLHLREPAEVETLRILIRTIQDLEQQHDCVFAPEILPLVMELPRRFVRGRAFPGKGAEILRQVAATHPGEEIGKQELYRFFENKTGIRQRFMDRAQQLETEAVESFFRERILGQSQALQAMIDTIVLAKAQLNDPERPIASMLFLGPTGVGKTESAKTLAEFYFGTPDRLLRFDMNEFNGWDAVPRLIGTFGGRQGILTGAVRRRPHAVILLDEIEKANPDVFDLLLQVLDDGRLTDANGVTTDFCNAVIIMTSNLGARDARSRIGFDSADREDTEVYLNAARQFFRPEFFNRLDKVVAFHELGREHIEGIVRNLVSRALQRQGLFQRQMSLSLDHEVYDLLSQLGFQKEYGARALRRAVEDHLVEPLAMQLSVTTGRRPAFIRGGVREGKVHLGVHELSAVPMVGPGPAKISAKRALELSRSANQFVRRIDEEMEAWREPDEASLSAVDQHYYAVREQLMELRRARDKLQHSAEGAAQPGQRRRSVHQPSRFGHQPKQLHIGQRDTDELLNDIFEGADSGYLIEQLAEQAQVLDPVSHQTNQLIQHAREVEYLSKPEFASADRMLVRFHLNRTDLKSSAVEGRFEVYKHWIESYVRLFQNPPALSKKIVWFHPEQNRVETFGEYSVANFLASDSYFLYGEGPGFRHLMEQEAGLELFCFASQGFEYGGIEVIPLRKKESISKACRRVCAEPALMMDRSTRVFRIRHERGWVLDLKSGLLTQNPKVSLWAFLMPMLEMPTEFT